MKRPLGYSIRDRGGRFLVGFKHLAAPGAKDWPQRTAPADLQHLYAEALVAAWNREVPPEVLAHRPAAVSDTERPPADLDALRRERDALAREVEEHAGGDRPSSPAAWKLRRLAELDAKLQAEWLDRPAPMPRPSRDPDENDVRLPGRSQ